MLRKAEFRMPGTLLQGPGCLEDLGREVGKLGCKKALIVSDEVMKKVGYVQKVETLLKGAGVDYAVFTDVPGEPQDTYVEAGLRVYREEKCDFLLAIGGGSPIDTAKAIGILHTNGGSITDYMGAEKVKKPIPPLVAIPTTAGTGSEVTRFTIITDTKNDVKMLINSSFIIPTVAIADPTLTLSVPPKTTAATGLDAFCHAVEAYVSKKEQPTTDLLALEAIRLISQNLRRAWCNGEDLEARSNMMRAATLAGIAFNNSSVTLIHGMSRPIGAVFHVAHGVSNALLLPTWAEFTYIAKPEKFAKVAEVMGENIEGLSVLDAAWEAVEAISRLCEDVEIPSIKDMGIAKEDYERALPKMARDAIASGSPANNPRSATEEQIIELYRKAY
ncbi:MAG: iron-containing alcohol dehydrogenase [Synergistales bacterium]|nr:iron-containing alcohol dehydrogenase [Synergistales bacterium]